ncbi:OmpW/AlkL family protein [Aquabacterium humicola]|uniref:OmpW/AlkL family protein n=1 Tax=Aquabacterium humicola TaxID=3237377 RepID=UPI002543E18D|nr:OmpW family outer membrane protein [Rubrivivax pictus]
MTLTRCLLALAAAAALSPVQAQDQGTWVVRARALHLQSADKDSTGFGLSINDRTFPEVDIGYFLSPNIALELVLTYPQKHTVHSTVVGADIGSFKHLPPTLLVQYHVTGLGGWRPYVGAGINYTNLSSVHFNSNVSALKLGLKHNSVGWAVQAGADVPIGGGWLINVDAKKVAIGTTVRSDGRDIGKFKVDPVLLSVGIGKRF